MNRIHQRAYGKINIGLDVLGRRENGYHEVRMIMQTVDIYDDLEMERTAQPGIRIQTDHQALPAGRDNLIYKAAELLMRDKGIAEGVEITLTKRIPIAAGMAGGSADAAAVMRGLNRLFDMGYRTEELQKLGVRLGADIPYCIVGGTMLSEGIGEILSPLPAPPMCYLAVAKPDIDVSTKFVYENLHADSLTWHPDIDGMADAIRAGNLQGMTERMGNVLEMVTARFYPIIEEIKELMRREGAMNALMSGSGPTVFGVYTNQEQAKRAVWRIEREGLAKQVFAATFCNPI
ncbi:MAG: 4-(cytidine 5'-diphospho)-2-C-methyl-D-erythritol kinase [Clostridiales bacterium]|nr:4-(cytidine 5'-diphospho)-2-C-methyl-D-erythritol kinase [Clostridiales bacterium]